MGSAALSATGAKCARGECILRENNQCSEFFILASGELKVTRQGHELDRLCKGGLFW